MMDRHGKAISLRLYAPPWYGSCPGIRIDIRRELQTHTPRRSRTVRQALRPCEVQGVQRLGNPEGESPRERRRAPSEAALRADPLERAGERHAQFVGRIADRDVGE